MASEEGYQRQVAVRPTTPRPSGSAESFGAGFGAEMERAGGELHREALQDYAIQRQATRDEEWTGFLSRYAQFQEDIDAKATEARKSAGPDHPQKMAEAWETGREALIGGITEDSVRRQATRMFDDGQTRFVIGEQHFEAAHAVNQTVLNAVQQRDLVANRVRRMDKTDDYLAAQQQQHDAIAGLNIGDVEKEKLYTETSHVLAASYIRGAIDRDPAMAKALLGSGAFDDVLDPDQLEQLGNRADVEIRSREVAARAAAAAQRSALTDEVNTTIKGINDGGERDPDELTALRGRAVAAGLDDAKLYEIDTAIARNDVNREFRAATPEQIAGEIAAIDTRLADQANDDPRLVLRRKALAELLPTRREQIADDPMSWAAQNGLKVAPFSLSASADDMQSWVRAADAAAKASGRPPQYLPPDGVAQLRSLAASGRAGALEALDFVARLPAGKRIEAARQIRPNDEAFAWLAALPHESRETALTGQEALKGKPDLLSYNKTDRSDLVEVSARQDAQFAQATVGMAGAQQSAVRAAWRNILAGFVATGHPLDAKFRWRAINQALGASGVPGPTMKGGIALWGGENTAFLVPQTMTAGEFKRRVQAAWGQNGPVNPDKSPASLSAAIPRMVGTGQYIFVSKGGRPFRRADGSIYTLDVGR